MSIYVRYYELYKNILKYPMEHMHELHINSTFSRRDIAPADTGLGINPSKITKIIVYNVLKN